MAVEKYSIGGTVRETEAFEAFADIPQNRVLLAEKLTANTPTKPEIVEELTTIEEVFAHFKPKVEINFETEDGTGKKETLHFTHVGDFGVKGITAQSSFLSDLSMKKEEFQKVIRQLKTNKLLKQAIADADAKQHLINALNAMIQELEEAK